MALRNIVRRIPPRLSGFPARRLSSDRRHHHAASVLLLYKRNVLDSAQPRCLSNPRQTAGFHTTPRRQYLPLIQVLATLFKTSAGLELTRTAGRIALTFFPILWLGRMREKRAIHYAAIHGIPVTEEKKQRHARNFRIKTRILRLLILVPVTLFWSAILVSLERTPLTGRWRVILLSPEEEDEIATQLAGSGWYKAVGEILASEGSPRILPTSDWRYHWVLDTLRRLEASIPVLLREPELVPNWMETGPNEHPLPPPAEYPLLPRPRASEYIHWVCDNITNQQPEAAIRPAITIPGPPYSLLVVDKPGSSNAFSYGFGANGGSGIVVYSGFLDDLSHRNPPPEEVQVKPSTLSWLFGGSLSSHTVQTHPKPTEEQTNELAILLAHEMAHLILSHHLESLSSFEVVVPGALSIFSDIVRVLIFPFTALLGPFVNDAVAQLGKVGSGELAKLGEYCTTKRQELEADIVSARILAHAGFDARNAITFWERRSEEEVECARVGKCQDEDDVQHLERKIASAAHPIGQQRVWHLRDELFRWEQERRQAIEQRRIQ